MGKKNRKKKHKNKNKNKKNTIKEKLSASIVTPTQDSRTDYLEVLIQCILQQDYNNILEWIIVDGTQNDDHNLRKFIEYVRKTYPDLPTIVFLEPEEGSSKTIGALRNLYNKHCKGDIIVCMDDDDFYPPTRVSHCVKRLTNSPYDIGACASLCIYAIEFQKVYEWKRFHINQGGNASMAYTNNYAKTHTYDDVSCGEEKTFIRNYMGYNGDPNNKGEQTMIQFDKEHSLLSIAHSSTYKKSKIFYDNDLRPKDKRFVFNSSFSLSSYVKNTTILKMYKRLFKKDDFEHEDVTIIYRSEHKKLQFSKILIGSELQQIEVLTNHLISKHKRIIVYTDIKDEEKKKVDGINIQNESIYIHNHVEYRNIYTIDSRQQFKDIIVIGKPSLELVPMLNIKYKQLHFINNDYTGKLDNSMFDDITLTSFINRTPFIRDGLLDNNSYVHDTLRTSIIMPLGIHKQRIDTIIQSLDTQHITRNPFRFCFTNSYEKGLLPIIQHIFPVLKKIQPKVELHLYGQLNEFTHPEMKKMIQTHIDQSGIIDHGVCPIEDIIKEKMTSSFHLYYTDVSKGDSLSVKESIYCNCIPLISTKDVFKSLVGCHFEFNTVEVQSYLNVANIVGQLLKESNKIDKLRNKLCVDKSVIPTIEDNLNIWDTLLGTK